MGGYYSGRWHWYTKKQTVNEYSRLKISDFAKATLAERFETGAPVYYDESGPARTTALIVDKVIDSMFRRQGKTPGERPEKPKNTGQPLRITRTACNYGNWRYWFVCPDCGRRCGILYRSGLYGRYACRKCHDLTYITAQDARRPPASIRLLACNIDRLTRAELVQRKMFKARVGSKNWHRLRRRYEKIMRGVQFGT